MDIEKMNLLDEMKSYDADKALKQVWGKVDEKKTTPLFIRLQRIAAVLFLPLLLGFASYFWVSEKKTAEAAMVWQTVETLPGQKSMLELPDGTRVWLNADTKLTYPVNFGQKTRQVRLSGEAFFDVEKDLKKAFTVDLGELNIKVLGTEFNVNNYRQNSSASVYLRAGSVELYTGDPSSRNYLYKMHPGDRVIYDKDQDELRVGHGMSDYCMAWMDGKIIFRGELMTDVVQKLNCCYNTDIRILDPNIESYTLTATFQDESLEQILELLKISAPIDYRINSRQQNEYNIFSKTRVELFAPE